MDPFFSVRISAFYARGCKRNHSVGANWDNKTAFFFQVCLFSLFHSRGSDTGALQLTQGDPAARIGVNNSAGVGCGWQRQREFNDWSSAQEVLSKDKTKMQSKLWIVSSVGWIINARYCIHRWGVRLWYLICRFSKFIIIWFFLNEKCPYNANISNFVVYAPSLTHQQS